MKANYEYPMNMFICVEYGAINIPKNHKEEFEEKYNHVITDDNCMNGLNYAISTLTDREQKALEEKFANYKTYDEVGLVLGVTRERIRQLIARACRKLRNHYLSDYYLKGKSFNNEENSDSNSDSNDTYIITTNTPIIECGFILSTRTINCLIRRGFNIINDVIEYINDSDNKTTWYNRIRNMGKHYADEFIMFLYNNNILPENLYELVKVNDNDAEYINNMVISLWNKLINDEIEKTTDDINNEMINGSHTLYLKALTAYLNKLRFNSIN